jgi:hypothetical protein
MILSASGKATPALFLGIIAITANNFRWRHAKKEYRLAPKEKSSWEASQGKREGYFPDLCSGPKILIVRPSLSARDFIISIRAASS